MVQFRALAWFVNSCRFTSLIWPCSSTPFILFTIFVLFIHYFPVKSESDGSYRLFIAHFYHFCLPLYSLFIEFLFLFIQFRFINGLIVRFKWELLFALVLVCFRAIFGLLLAGFHGFVRRWWAFLVVIETIIEYFISVRLSFTILGCLAATTLLEDSPWFCCWAPKCSIWSAVLWFIVFLPIEPAIPPSLPFIIALKLLLC